MKLTQIILVFMCFFLTIGCSIYTGHKLSESDKELIVKITTEYYKNLNEGNYEIALFNLAKSTNLIDMETRIITLNELSRAINYRIQWNEEITIGDVSYNRNEKMPFLYTIVSVNYDNTIGRDINEVLYFTKTNGEWKIKKVESSDRYLPYRTADYSIPRTLEELKPTNID
ncbi:hypothetical protein [Paenibacillus apii]|uniref:hypothetical protein n=1 Tax=Paenibacillus apii TaxID=1850370 RepID=UPI00143A4C85|nr:hypothetical protein [Paenibacillus apii]NJJ42442.1 hypothetical protein [Paenibacillus apii]